MTSRDIDYNKLVSEFYKSISEEFDIGSDDITITGISLHTTITKGDTVIPFSDLIYTEETDPRSLMAGVFQECDQVENFCRQH